MDKFKVYTEGYACSGDSAKAQYLGEFEGETFKEACKEALKQKSWDMRYYDDKNNTYWACGFFDNEEDAIKSFG